MTYSNNNFLSTALFVVFATGLFVFGYYTALFYPKNKTFRSLSGISESNLISPPFRNNNIKQIELKNRMGNYKFVQFNDQWVMIDHDESSVIRKLPVKNEVIKNILAFTQKYEILKEVQNNDINFKSYSFDSPLYSITYTDLTEDKYDFRLGVNNTLDDSNYLFHAKLNKILRIKPLKNEFARLTLEYIVDPQILSLKEEQIISLKVEKDSGSYTHQYSNLKKINGKWYNSKKQEIEKERLTSALQYLSEIKSSLVISEFNFKNLNSNGRSSPKSPILTLEIQHNSKDSFVYKIHQPEQNMPSLNIDKKNNLIVESSLHNSLFVVNRNSLTIFENLKEQKLNKLDLERIFY